MSRLLVFLLALLSVSCATKRPLGSFRVLPANPEYLLRSPDALETPFPEVLRHYNSFVAGQGSLDLRPQMQLRIENAYYREGMPKRGLAGFLGTEIARYQVRPKGGLRKVAVESTLPQRPADQPPVGELIRLSQTHHRYYRFFYAVVFRRQGERRGSVLLGARSSEELDRLTNQLLAEPESICGGPSLHCTVFPEACTVSPEIEIVVNNAPRTVPWGSVLGNVAARPKQIALLRLHAGRLTPVEINPSDPNALRLPLLPGDQIRWE